MMTRPADRLIEQYIRRLRAELRDLPSGRRQELLEEIQAHIAEGRLALASETEVEIRSLLDRVGDPADIAAEARERFGIRPVRRGLVEILALILLPVGGVLIPLLGWLMGVILLWASNAWNRRERLIGTFLLPGGLLPAFLLVMGVVGGPAESCEVFEDASNREFTRCTVDAPLDGILGAFVLAALVLIPIGTALYLALKLRQRSADGTAV
jgi:hypothetical protein